MKVLVELFCCVVVLVILGGLLQVHSWQQKQLADHALPNPDWVSRPAGSDPYARLKNASEKYGRYQWVMAPQRESLGTELSGKATVDGEEVLGTGCSGRTSWPKWNWNWSASPATGLEKSLVVGCRSKTGTRLGN